MSAGFLFCPVCGNEEERGSLECRFCGAEITGKMLPDKVASIIHHRVNLERGRPTVETALKRLDLELDSARQGRVSVLTLIHGYGSSGKGGSIRIECRKVLDYLVQQKQLNSYIPGENFHKRSGAGKALIRRYPDLTVKCESDFNNPGVSLVVL